MSWTTRIGHWITSWGIFARLSLVFGSVILVSTVTLGLMLRGTGEDAVKNSVWRDQKEIAARTAGEIEQLVKGPIENLRLTAVMMSQALESPLRSETLLIELVLSLSVFRRVALSDITGREIVSSDMQESTEDRSKSPGFQIALTDRFYRSDIRIDEEAEWGGMPIITLACPVKDSNRIVGILWAEVDLTDMWRLVDSIEIGETGRVFVVSDRGVVIAHPEKSRVFKEERVGDMEIIKKALLGETGTDEMLQNGR